MIQPKPRDLPRDIPIVRLEVRSIHSDDGNPSSDNIKQALRSVLTESKGSARFKSGVAMVVLVNLLSYKREEFSYGSASQPSVDLMNGLEIGKHEAIWSTMTKERRKDVMDIMFTTWKRLMDENPSVASNVGNMDHIDITNAPSFESPIVQSVDINTKSTSYVRVAGASAKDQPKVNSNFRPLVVDLVFNGVNISIPYKVVKKIVSPPIVATSNVVTPTVKKTNNGFQTATISAPKKRATNVGNASKSSSLLKTTCTSSKNDNITTSNSYSALNDEEEDVENVYD
uniref:Zinc knuckle CX2CX4HX4C n=1 Tax=Tanacetum cinerariifolium TaxID=118510 RepID=A0A6L2NSV0_TANCI|nr:zinc knuckle CX2CX4HX4C [Tanacetum cinerariifolium]